MLSLINLWMWEYCSRPPAAHRIGIFYPCRISYSVVRIFFAAAASCTKNRENENTVVNCVRIPMTKKIRWFFSRRIILTQQRFSDRCGITRVSRVNVSEGQAAGSGFEIKGSPRYIIRSSELDRWIDGMDGDRYCIIALRYWDSDDWFLFVLIIYWRMDGWMDEWWFSYTRLNDGGWSQSMSCCHHFARTPFLNRKVWPDSLRLAGSVRPSLKWSAGL